MAEVEVLIGLRSAVEALVAEKGWNNPQLGQAVGDNTTAVFLWRKGTASDVVMQRITPKMRQLLARERQAKVEEAAAAPSPVLGGGHSIEEKPNAVVVENVPEVSEGPITWCFMERKEWSSGGLDTIFTTMRVTHLYMYACLFALQLEEWQILVELRDATEFASWSQNKEGWDTLEEHHDPSRCAGVTMESGKITKIGLNSSDLMGGESHVDHKVAPVDRVRVYSHVFSALPDSIGQLSSLESLNVRDNKLSGTIYF
jgi:hypothetical protein